jgi:hypothetical protein
MLFIALLVMVLLSADRHDNKDVRILATPSFCAAYNGFTILISSELLVSKVSALIDYQLSLLF